MDEREATAEEIDRAIQAARASVVFPAATRRVVPPVYARGCRWCPACREALTGDDECRCDGEACLCERCLDVFDECELVALSEGERLTMVCVDCEGLTK